MNGTHRPLLIFFTSETSGPGRRMDSLVAHFARKERARVRVVRVDTEQRPEVATRFGIEEVPALVLVTDDGPVHTIRGRATGLQIEEMIEQHVA